MKKQYIRQVRKDLHIPRSAKTEELIEFWASYADCVNAFLAAYQQTEEAK